MFSLRRVVLFGLAAVSAVQAVTFADVLNDVKAADTTTQQIVQLCQAYTGTSSQFVTFVNTVKKHESQIQQATTDTQNSPTPTTSQYQSVQNFLCGQSLNNLKKALTCLQQKKSVFQQQGTLTTICNELQKLKGYFDAFFDALIAKAPTAALKQALTNCKAQFDAAFNNLLANFCA